MLSRFAGIFRANTDDTGNMTVGIQPNVNVTSHLGGRGGDSHVHFCDAVAVLRLSAALLLRAGYVLIQIGSVPVSDVNAIIRHNVIDVSTTLCAYALVGHAFAFGRATVEGLFGNGAEGAASDLDRVVFGFSACLIGSSAVTTATCGRVLAVAACAVAFAHASLLLPVTMHWAWHEYGWMARASAFGLRFAIKDHAGGVAVHLASGTVALWAAACLGRRLVRLKDVHVGSMGAEAPGTTFVGYTFVLIGLIAFTLPTQKYELEHLPDDFVGKLLINGLMGVASGATVLLLQWACCGRASGYWSLLRCLQGSVAGTVALASGVDVYEPVIALGVAASGAALFFVAACVSERMFYDDYCNVVPTHVVCALFGAALPPLLGNKENLGSTVPFAFRIYHACWQMTCCAAVVLWMTAFYLPLFAFLQSMGLLATRDEELNHRRSVNVLKNVGRASLFRIFSVNETMAPFLEPGAACRSRESLDGVLKARCDGRRRYLEAAMSRNERKPSSTRLTSLNVEDIVKDMGILQEERYPEAYMSYTENRLKDPSVIRNALMVATKESTEKCDSSSVGEQRRALIKTRKRYKRVKRFRRIPEDV